jgi:hypothetical protein
LEKNDSFSIREHREYDFGFRLDLDFQHSFLKDTTEIVYYFEYNIKIMIQISHRDIENKSLIMFHCQRCHYVHIMPIYYTKIEFYNKYLFINFRYSHLIEFV